MKVLFAIYELLIALPLFILSTIFCAVFTMCTIKWANSDFVHNVQVAWARSFCYLFLCKVTIDGTVNIQEGQSYVFICNHQSIADVFVVYGWLPVKFKWIMKQEIMKIPLVGTACKAAGHIFLDRKSRGSAVRSIKAAENTLHNGISVVVFPEGTRSEDGQVGRFKRGAFQIAYDLELPMIPISLSGCREMMPKGATIVNLGKKVHMHIDKPIDTKTIEQEQIIELTRDIVIKNIKQM